MNSKLQETIVKIGTLVLVVLFSLFVGKMMGGGRVGPIVAIVFAVIGLILISTLKERIWIAIPGLWLLQHQIPIVGIPLAARDFVVLYVAFGIALMSVFKVINSKLEFRWIDVLVSINIFYVVVLFIRNPAGVEFLGSEVVGGRGYFNIGIAACAYIVIGRVKFSEELARWGPRLVIIAAGFIAMLNIISDLSFGAGDFLSQFYAGIDLSMLESGGGPQDERGRKTWLLDIGRYGVLYLCVMNKPSELVRLTNPFRFLLLILLFTAILATGFRNIFFWAAMVFLISGWFHSGLMTPVKIVSSGLVFITALALGHGTLYNLPHPYQRTLSFIPGIQWDMNAIYDAEESTNWRIEIWKDVFFSDRYIRDRIFGDGIGFLRHEYNIVQAIRVQRNVSTEDSQTMAAMMGEYHSGPLSTLKIAGYVGGTLFLVSLFSAAIYTVRVIKRSRKTRFFGAALFFGVPIVFEPIFFIAIFGKYELALPSLILGVAVMRAMERTLDALEASARVSPPALESAFHAKPQLIS